MLSMLILRVYLVLWSFFTLSPLFSHELPIKEITQWFEEELVHDAEEKGIPGFAAGVVYKGNIVMAKTHGVRSLASRLLVTKDTVFQLGSLSKAVSGTFMGVLSQKGHVNLDKPLASFIPEFGYAPESLKLRHVLTHTTGLPRFGFNSLIEAERHDRDGIFQRLGRAQPVCAPGECYDYHNAAYGLTAPVAEKITGKSFEEGLHDHLLKPLNMSRTSASYESLLKYENRAHPHQKTKKGFIQCSKYRLGYYEVAPAGGINSSLNDMLLLLKAFMGYRPDVINQETLAMLYTPYTQAKDFFERSPHNTRRFRSSSYGMGFRIIDYEGHKIVFHTGWVKGFINIVAFLPERDMGIVILQNAETSFPWKMAMTFFDRVLGIPPKNWDTAPKVQKIAQKTVKAKYKKEMKRTKGVLSQKTKQG